MGTTVGHSGCGSRSTTAPQASQGLWRMEQVQQERRKPPCLLLHTNRRSPGPILCLDGPLHRHPPGGSSRARWARRGSCSTQSPSWTSTLAPRKLQPHIQHAWSSWEQMSNSGSPMAHTPRVPYRRGDHPPSRVTGAEPRKSAVGRLLLSGRRWGGEGPILTHKTSASCSPPPPTTDTLQRTGGRRVGAQVSAGATPTSTPPSTAHSGAGPELRLLPHPAHSPKGLLVLGPKPPSGPSPGWHPGLTQFLPRGSRRRKEEGFMNRDSSLCTAASPRPGREGSLPQEDGQSGRSPSTLTLSTPLVL